MLKRLFVALLFAGAAFPQAQFKDTLWPVQSVAATTLAPIAVTATASTDRLAAATIPLDGATGTFTSTGNLPGGINGSTTYYVVQRRAGDFRVATVQGGTQVNITNAGSGTVSFVPDGWVHFAARQLQTGYAYLQLTQDRSQLTGADFNLLLEVEIQMSLDNGSVWGGTFNEGGVQYPLEIGFATTDGQLIHPRTGQVVLESTRGTPIPQQGSTTRMIRGRYRVHLTKSWGLSIDLR
jgi:hypothetical protein